jgi:hypothetical protein
MRTAGAVFCETNPSFFRRDRSGAQSPASPPSSDEQGWKTRRCTSATTWIACWSTIVDFGRERRTVSEEAVDKMQQALAAAGVKFIDENGGGAGVRLRKPLQAKPKKE